jgi:hypothetical protein
MPSLINHPKAANFTYKFRSYCLTDKQRGKWRDKEEDALQDVANHKAKANNSSHKVVVEVEQKYNVVV